MQTLAWIVAVGIGATLVMDLWGLAQRRLLKARTLDYALVGRWVGHMTEGRLRHSQIAAVAPVRHERLLGWFVHYATGVGFAGALLALGGSRWAAHPSPQLAIAVGIATVGAPFAIMQPALGFGFAGARLPSPWRARGRSLATHVVFGGGLYLAALALAQLDGV
jgi:hypothetical protein